eukprot:1191626-Prorocentrum_minimum.AAC.7
MASRRPFLRETPMEKLHRYRGVILVGATPVLLILLVIAIMPRASPHDDLVHLGNVVPDASATGDGLQYAVVIDAGSTGSRVHTYRFKPSAKGPELIDDDFHQLKPGLSSFADTPDKGAESLTPLLEAAVARVPASAQSVTTIEVRATAGLRLLPGDKAEDLLAAVRRFLAKYPFTFDDSSVSIMDGADEGAYQWVTINYLIGAMGGPPSQTVAAVDLGGGSVQLAYALPQNTAASAPRGYVRALRGGGAHYHVYVHSHLGYGLMAGRAAILEADGKACLPAGANGTYAYGGKKYAASAGEASSDLSGCETAVTAMMNEDKSCSEETPKGECGFNGVWTGGGGDGKKAVYVSSYFFDRAEQSGILQNPDVDSEKVPPTSFAKAAGSACSAKSLSALASQFPKVGENDLPYFCMDLAYCNALLSKGFGLSAETDMTLVKRISYKGTAVEAAWPLGAAINSLG